MATPTDGKWIIVNGAHVFIKNGQNVGDAISEHATKNSSKSSSKKKEKSASEIVADAKKAKSTTIKLPDAKSTFATDVKRMQKLKKENYKEYTVQLEKLHSKYTINKWNDLYKKTL